MNTSTQAEQHSVESEKLILAAALDVNRKSLLDTMLGVIAGSDFSVEFHGVLWNCIRMLHETGMAHDATALLDYTRNKNLFVGGVEFLAGLVDDPLASTASDESILAAGGRVKTYAAMRSLQAMLVDAQRMCQQSGSSLESVLSFVDDGVQSLRKTVQTSRTGAISMMEVMDKVMLTMEQQAAGEIQPATSTGFEDLDKIAFGFADEDLVVIGARPSMGKTALLTNLADNIGMNTSADKEFLIFSMEMKDTSLGQRTLARRARVDLTSIIRAEMGESDWSRVVEGIEQLRDSRVWIDDSPGLTIHDIRARSRSFAAKHVGKKIVIAVDYLQYVSQGNGRAAETKDHVSEVSRGLKNLARELKCPVIALSQLSRTLESRANKRPIMSDLRESGAIEQDADLIMFLYRDEVYNPDTKEPGIAEVIVAKHRNGPTGVAKLGYAGPTSSFFNMSNAY